MFNRITANNLSIDLTLENLVNIACIRDEREPRADRSQIEKTSQLLLHSSLILGESDLNDGKENAD